jgi:hypothetical protein
MWTIFQQVFRNLCNPGFTVSLHILRQSRDIYFQNIFHLWGKSGGLPCVSFAKMFFVLVDINQGANKQKNKKNLVNTPENVPFEKPISSLKLMVPEFWSIYLQQCDNDPNSESHKPSTVPAISVLKFTRSQTILLHFAKQAYGNFVLNNV